MKNNPIPALIDAAIAGTAPRTSARNRALASIKWTLITPNGTIGMRGTDTVLVDKNSPEASVFDGRDNEVRRVAFFTALLKLPVEVALCGA